MKPLLRIAVIGCLAALLTGLTPPESRAETLFGVTFFDNELIAVDTATGAGRLIAPLGQELGAYGLARFNNQLYAFDSNADVLRTINPATGAIASTINLGLGNLIGEGDLAIRGDGVGVISTAINPTTFESSRDLYRFNLATNTSTLVGQTSVVFDGLAFAPNGTLYGLEQLGTALYTIDPFTAATTLVGSTGFPGGSGFGALTFGLGGTLFAAVDDRLFTINLSSGLATAVDPDPLNFIGFSSVSGLAAVPEPSSVALAGVGLAAVLVARLRRRRVA